MVPQTLVCMGLGYTARAFADDRARAGWRVRGTHRDPSQHPDPPHPILRFGDPDALADATHVLVSVPPDDAGDPTLRAYAAALSAHPSLKWIGYLSSTGVYGDHHGAWVDEHAELHPTSARGLRRLRAETQWRASGLPVQIFRLAGIYGPGRSPLERLARGLDRRVARPGYRSARIHVDDITTALCAGIDRGPPDLIVNVADDEPAPPEEVLAFACELRGVAPPPVVDWELAELSPMARSFYADRRLVANTTLRKTLGVSLRYPTYREGLRALNAP